MAGQEHKESQLQKIQDVVKCGNSAFVLNFKDLLVVLRRYWINEQFLQLVTYVGGLLLMGLGGGGLYFWYTSHVYGSEVSGSTLIFLLALAFVFIVGHGMFSFWHLGFVNPSRFLVSVVYQKRCRLGEPVYNILDFLNKEALDILHIIYTGRYEKVIHASTRIKDIIDRVGVEKFDLNELVEYYKQKQSLVLASSKGLNVTLLKETVLWATYYGIKFNAVTITDDLIFLGFLRALNSTELLSGRFHVSLEDIEKVVEWHANNERTYFLHKTLNVFAPYIRKRGMIDDWFIGFTFYISKMSTEIVEFLKYNPGVYNLAHPGLDQKLIEVLLKPVTPNALLVGAPGTGKTSVIYGLAQRIVEADVPQALLHKRIFSIDLSKMIAFVNEAGGVAKFLSYLENELKQNPEAIFFVDDIALLFEGETQKELLLQLLTLLTKYNIPIVATMTFTEYAKFKVDYATLAVNFEVIEVPEATEEATYSILTTKIEEAERKYRVKILFPALAEIIYLTKIYMPADKFPKKAIVIFDKALALAQAAREKVLTPEIVRKAVENTTKIKIGVGDKEAINKLMHLEEHIHQRYVNQEIAVHELVEALKRARLQLTNPNKPIGVFLFLGPTGVGKTYLAKIAAQEFFGTQHRIIRVDLSQYKLATDIYHVLKILSQVRLSPYSLILLDEFEKAHPDIHDMFLRMFDEGVIRDENGEEMFFTNSLIVATSNIGSREILKVGTNYSKAKQIITSMLPMYLKPELINRFDSIIIFRALTKEELLKVADLLLKELRFELDKKHIRLLWDDVVLKTIVEKAYDPAMGARPIRRFVEDKVKTIIANYILNYRAKHGTYPEVVDLRPKPKVQTSGQDDSGQKAKTSQKKEKAKDENNTYVRREQSQQEASTSGVGVQSSQQTSSNNSTRNSTEGSVQGDTKPAMESTTGQETPKSEKEASGSAVSSNTSQPSEKSSDLPDDPLLAGP